MTGILGEQWLRFKRDVIRNDPPPEILLSMKMAFYGGASLIYHAIMHGLSPGDEPTDADLEMLRGILREIREFADEMKAAHNAEMQSPLN